MDSMERLKVKTMNISDSRVVNFPDRDRGQPKKPDMADRHVGTRIRLQRTLIGMSQEKLADVLGITFQQIQKYEKGTNRIGAGRLLAVAKALGVPISFFFEGYATGGDQQAVASELQTLLATREGVALAQAFVRIDNLSLRQGLVAMAQAAAKNSQ